MRRRLFLPLALTAWLAGSLSSVAQDLAPDSLTNLLVSLTIANGAAPFSDHGRYWLFASVVSTNYLALGGAGAPLSHGAYAYTKTGANAGTLDLADSESGTGSSMRVLFASPTNGVFGLTNGSGFQNGTFSAAPYFDATGPGLSLFLPGAATNGSFEAYLSGAPGIRYSIETSTNLTDWSPLVSLTLADLSANFSDPTSAGTRQQFYRAKAVADDFAPDSLAGKTLNLTINEGAGPLPTNGIFQWMADTNGNGYAILGGPGMTNSSGTYSYTRTGPDSGVITYSDSLAGNVNEPLVFTSLTSGYFYLTDATPTAFQTGTFTLADGPVEFLGNVKFVPDTARSGSLYFAADSSPATLSVTNAAGWVWTLNFPADALLSPRAITLTPFAGVDSSAAKLPVSAGVQLEPDGLQFSDGVTLTVTPPAPLGPHASLMMAGNDGSDLYFVQSTNRTGSYSTVLMHFTSAEASDPSDQQWQDFLSAHQSQLPQAEAAYGWALADVRGLKRVVVVPPEPPDYEFKCYEDPKTKEARLKMLDDYQKELFKKESAAIQRLLDAERGLTLFTGDDDSRTAETRAAVLELTRTAVFRKVDFLFRHYGGNPQKFAAVVRLVRPVLRQVAAYGGDENSRPDWSDQIRSWAIRVKEYYFDKLRKEHDYSMVSVLKGVERTSEYFGATDPDNNNFLAELADALMFKLSMDISGDVVSGGEWQAQAKGDVAMTVDSLLNLQGSGTINYVSGHILDAGLVAGQSYSINPLAALDACTNNPTATLYLDRFATDKETYDMPEIGPTPIPGLLFRAAGAFSDRLQKKGIVAGLYAFTAPLRNGQAEALNQTYTGTIAEASFTLKLVLLHTPK